MENPTAAKTPLLSLCFITGNRSVMIRRFLDSFAPHVDEICCVRAIGASEPDDTLDIVRAYGARVQEFANTTGLVHPTDGPSAGWEHTDDFAGARDASFALATGRYLLWADTDDVLDGRGAFLREFAASGKFDGLQFRYNVLGQSVNFDKLRVVRAGSCRWRRPIHEALVPVDREKFVCARTDDVTMVHSPWSNHRAEKGNRNLRIIEALPPEAFEQDQQLHYYHHQELLASGRVADAVRVGFAAVDGAPKMSDTERYEILLNLGLIGSKDKPKEAEAALLRAYGMTPERREALCLLSSMAADREDGERALSFARAFDALPIPKDQIWTLRRRLYGVGGDAIHAQALRLVGREVDGDEIEAREFKRSRHPRISLLHAARGRVVEGAQTRSRWLEAAMHPERVEHIFAFAIDDMETGRTLSRFRYTTSEPGLHKLPGGNAVANWNAAAREATGDILAVIADDLEPAIGWDMEVERLLDVTKPQVLVAPDGVRNKEGVELICHPILTRAYYHRLGNVFDPEYRGVFCDNEFTDRAKQDGVCVYDKDARIYRHNHPVGGEVPMDAVHAHMNSREAYEFGRAVYERRKAGKSANVPTIAEDVTLAVAYDLGVMGYAAKCERSLAEKCNVPYTVYGVNFHHQPRRGRGVRLDSSKFKVAHPCIQHGEFLMQDNGPAHDQIMVFIDADTVMQRGFTAEEISLFRSLDKNSVLIGPNESDGETLGREAEFLRAKLPLDEIRAGVGDDVWQAPCRNTGVIACRVQTYLDIYRKTCELWPKFAPMFGHPAALQWTICAAVKLLGLRLMMLPRTIHTHGCHGTPDGAAVIYDGTVLYRGEVVAIAHNIGCAAKS